MPTYDHSSHSTRVQRANPKEVSAASRSTYDSYNHRQPGDPAKLGRVMVSLAAMSEPPLHFVAGSDAVSFARATFVRRTNEVEVHAELSATTDGDF
jgi:hypothetical protein